MDKDTSVPEVIDELVSYKINRYSDKIERCFKKLKGEGYCDSEIINYDVVDPQIVVNSLTDKIIYKS